MLFGVLRPDEELRELESLSLAIKIMFCIREKVLLLDINQQNDKPTQGWFSYVTGTLKLLPLSILLDLNDIEKFIFSEKLQTFYILYDQRNTCIMFH